MTLSTSGSLCVEPRCRGPLSTQSTKPQATGSVSADRMKSSVIRHSPGSPCPSCAACRPPRPMPSAGSACGSSAASVRTRSLAQPRRRARALASAAQTHNLQDTEEEQTKPDVAQGKKQHRPEQKQTLKTSETIDGTKSQVFKKINKINKPLAKLTRKKKKDSYKIRNE